MNLIVGKRYWLKQSFYRQINENSVVKTDAQPLVQVSHITGSQVHANYVQDPCVGLVITPNVIERED